MPGCPAGSGSLVNQRGCVLAVTWLDVESQENKNGRQPRGGHMHDVNESGRGGRHDGDKIGLRIQPGRQKGRLAGQLPAGTRGARQNQKEVGDQKELHIVDSLIKNP